MTNLQPLLDRLEAASGCDERLNGELDGLVDHENEAWPPNYTESLDAALALVERKLPDADFDISKRQGQWDCRWCDSEADVWRVYKAPTAPLALLIAMCRTLTSEQD